MLTVTEDNCFTQIVNQPTRGKSILDLFFTTNESLINKVETMPPLSESDHDIIYFNISAKARSNIKSLDLSSPWFSNTLKN